MEQDDYCQLLFGRHVGWTDYVLSVVLVEPFSNLTVPDKGVRSGQVTCPWTTQVDSDML